MIQQEKQHVFDKLRDEFPFFVYQDYTISYKTDRLDFSFKFNLSDKFVFNPSYSIYFNDATNVELNKPLIENIIFNIGMVELVSYWKAACPVEVIIDKVKLDENQVKWWKNLYFKGLGEFFWLNGINADADTFMNIKSQGDRSFNKDNIVNVDNSKVIVPVGGGKDSVVTLELLKDKMKVLPFAVNPRGAIKNTVKAAGFNESDIFSICRNLDPLLLELNSKGFLNGHTPFSAIVAFNGLLAACLTEAQYIALSNEASANEPTVAGSAVNHQYSKSLDFERDFREYVFNYITPSVEYFSFLRPLSELQIARLFSEFKHQYRNFRSCNAGSKTDSWCCSCPKCLFTWIILSPFISQEELIKIFGSNVLDNMSLAEDLERLTGKLEVKPFECVGTVEEVNIALNTISKNYNKPELVKHFINIFDKQSGDVDISEYDFRKFHSEHFLPPFFEKLLNDSLC